MDIEAYRHHLYFIMVVILTGLILQEVIKRLIKSLDTDFRKNSVKTAGTPLTFFYKTGSIFSWTASIYFGCKIYYVKLLPGEFFYFLSVIMRIEAVIIVMFFLSYGINHLIKNILSNKNLSHEDKRNSQPVEKRPLTLAIVNAISWSSAFIISAMSLNVILFSSIISILFLAVILACALIFLYYYSEQGYQLITGIIGYLYLRDEKINSDPGKPFRLKLEDGQLYEVKRISLLHTSFLTETNSIEIRDNSLLMILNFGFKPWKGKDDIKKYDVTFENSKEK